MTAPASRGHAPYEAFEVSILESRNNFDKRPARYGRAPGLARPHAKDMPLPAGTARLDVARPRVDNRGCEILIPTLVGKRGLGCTIRAGGRHQRRDGGLRDAPTGRAGGPR